MAQIPFLVILEAELAASGLATLAYQISNQESLDIVGWRQQSTGTFDVRAIRTSDGQHYTQASATAGIPSEFIPDVGDGYNAVDKFPIPLRVGNGQTIYIEIADTSVAANTVTIVLLCNRTVGT